MKTVYVNNQVVQLNNNSENEALTPAIVRGALSIAFGHTAVNAIVRDTHDAYKVTPRAIRKMSAEESYDAGCDF